MYCIEERGNIMSSYILHIAHAPNSTQGIAGITGIVILTTQYTVTYLKQSQVLQFLLLNYYSEVNLFRHNITRNSRYTISSSSLCLCHGKHLSLNDKRSYCKSMPLIPIVITRLCLSLWMRHITHIRVIFIS